VIFAVLGVLFVIAVRVFVLRRRRHAKEVAVQLVHQVEPLGLQRRSRRHRFAGRP
jgi:hypothetical protein